MTAANWRNPPAGFVRAAKAVAFGVSLLPLAGLLVDAVNDNLGANPIEEITRTTGWWTLTYLMITLSVTPFRKLSGWPWIGRLRRMLGLFAFFYGSLHFLTYFVLDQFFDWPAILKDIAKRPYITLGFTAFVLMAPLAATSTDAMVRRLGGRAWRGLHRLVYAVAVIGVAHFWWLTKKDLSQPTRFAAVLALLLGLRIAWAWRGERRARNAGSAIGAD
jgi:sulfoxide reductase heme-binding subunit YedZ